MLANVTPLGLPWALQLELMTAAPEYLLIVTPLGGTKLGYMVTCLTILGETLDECTQAEATQELKNLTSSVEGVSNEENTGNCTVGGEKANDVVGSVITTLNSKEALSVSGTTEESNQIVLERGIHDFGEVSLGSKVPRTEAEEFESTKNPVKYEASTLTNIKGKGFTYAKDTCTGKIAAKALCEVVVTFTPELPVGEEFTATLELEYENETTKEAKLKESFSLKGVSAK